jgi:hypothetical protein
MSKRSYRLLKPLPDANVGTFFVNDGNGNYDYTSKDGTASFYHQHQVEENPEWFSEIILPESKEWEIVSFYDKLDNATPFRTINDPYHKYRVEQFIGNDRYYIHSVLRKSDGIVFSVGDEVTYIRDAGVKASYESFIIDHMRVSSIPSDENRLLVFSKNEGICEEINSRLVKLPTSSKENKEDSFKWDEKCLSVNDVVDMIRSQCDGTYQDAAYWNFVDNDAPSRLITLLKQSKHPIEPKTENVTVNVIPIVAEELWSAARLTHPLAGMKYDTLQDYLKTLNPIDKK